MDGTNKLNLEFKETLFSKFLLRLLSVAKKRNIKYLWLARKKQLFYRMITPQTPNLVFGQNNWLNTGHKV